MNLSKGIESAQRAAFTAALVFFLYSVCRADAEPTPQTSMSSSYSLEKTGISPQNNGVVSEQFLAANNTLKDTNCFLVLRVPYGVEVQSVTSGDGASVSIQNFNGSFLAGPVSIAANGSVSLTVSENNPPRSNQTGESFVLLSESQLGRAPLSSNSKAKSDGSSLAGQGLLRSVAAAPNVSRGGQPVNFLVDLNAPALIHLSLFTLVGEEIYSAEYTGNTGMNTLQWNLQNGANQAVASGLYFYYLQFTGFDGSVEKRTGKILIIH